MAHESIKQPVHPDRIGAGDRGSDETRATNGADLPGAAKTGVDERHKAQKEGKHIPATDASGKPYGHDDDADAHEDGVDNIGR